MSSARYPSIPIPGASLESVRSSVMALKEGYELLVGIRGPGAGLALTGAAVSSTTIVTAPTLILATGSSTPRSLEDRFAEVRNVLDFGAVGDGVTDDTVAIQAAQNAITSAKGGIVEFPPGRYKTTAPINVTRHSVKFRGPVRGQNNSIGTQIVGSGGHDLIRVGAFFYFELESIQLEHPIAATPAPANAQLRLTGSSNVSIDGCGFRYFWDGLVIDGGGGINVRDTQFTRCMGDGTSDAHGILITDASGSIVTVVKVQNVGLAGFYNTANTYGLRIRGGGTMYFSQMGITTWGFGVVTEPGPVTADVPTFGKFHNIELEHNTKGWQHRAGTRYTLVDCQVALTDNGPGYHFGPNASGEVMLTACKAVNNKEHGYLFDGTGGPNSGSFSMTGCMASGNGTAASGVYDGVYIDGTSNITITGGRYGGWGSNSTPNIPWQSAGIRVASTASKGISIVGADLTGNINAGFATVVTAGADMANIVGCLGAPTGPQLPSYAVAGLPAAASNPRVLLYANNEVGGAVPVFSDGTNWRRVTDRAIAA